MAIDRILVVDDEPGVRTALQGILVDEGFDVVCVEAGEDAVTLLGREEFDAVLLDIWLPGIDGIEVLKQIGAAEAPVGQGPAVVMISGHGTIETAVRATKLGAFDFIEKPLSLERTLLVLRNALRQRMLERRNRRLVEQLARDSEIVGCSAAAERLRADVERASGSEASVLICGEPGSGREMIARRIHAAGGRAQTAFVDVPCGALDPATASRTLLGGGDVPGRVELASGGTLFLEDADRLPAEVQRQLASSWRRITGANIRALASAPPGAEKLEPQLRHQLEVIRIDVPALRERREDIPPLLDRYLRELAHEYGRRPKRLAADGLSVLKAHDWPGNVVELRNLTERLVLMGGEAETVRLADLPGALGGARLPAEDLYREFESLGEGVRAFERYYIGRVLAEEGADTAAAAARLRITEDTLRMRIRTLD